MGQKPNFIRQIGKKLGKLIKNKDTVLFLFIPFTDLRYLLS